MGRLAQLVGYLGWLVGCYYALLVALKSWKRSKPMLTRRWSIFASSLKSSKGDVGKGTVRPHMSIILACLSLPSVLTGFAAGYYAREARQSRNTEVYTWVKVLKVYDAWNFQGQFAAGGNPFKLHFAHDGPDKKLGLDEGMTLELLKFEKKQDGLSVADDSLGVIVHRDKAGKFIDWRAE
jgi:hypothetical protein